MSIVVGWIKTAFIELMKDPEITAWIDQRFATAISGAESTLMANLEGMEEKLLTEVQQLPAHILGEAETDVRKLLGGQTGELSNVINEAMKVIATPLSQIPGLGGFKWPF